MSSGAERFEMTALHATQLCSNDKYTALKKEKKNDEGTGLRRYWKNSHCIVVSDGRWEENTLSPPTVRHSGRFSIFSIVSNLHNTHCTLRCHWLDRSIANVNDKVSVQEYYSPYLCLQTCFLQYLYF